MYRKKQKLAVFLCKALPKKFQDAMTARIKFITPRETVIMMKNRMGAVQGSAFAKGIEIKLQESPATICAKSVKPAE